MTVPATMQLTLQLQTGLTQQHPTLRAVTLWTAINHRGNIAGLAPALDMSPSELGRKLNGNPDDPHRTLDIDTWVQLVQASGDHSVMQYLGSELGYRVEPISPRDELTDALENFESKADQILKAIAAVQRAKGRK